VCGVIGFYSKKPTEEHVELVCRLFEESKIRGLHAFGVAIRTEKGLTDFKTFDFEDMKRWLRLAPKFDVLIGHNRYSTSGDYHNHKNNQPISIERTHVVFNGVITQASRNVYEKTFGKTYVTENDGEIFARKVVDMEDWAGFVFKGKFSFAGAFLQNDRAVALRNKNRPLWISEANGARFIASTQNIFTRAGFESSKEIPPGRIVDLCSSL
jgi:glutamine phosphoribosylpyrophosphate amidotransferase